MLSRNSKEVVHPIYTVGILRCTFYFFTKTIHANDKYCCAERFFMVRFLKYHKNEALENIPYIVRHTLTSTEKDIF
jgi:hypothetical protein